MRVVIEKDVVALGAVGLRGSAEAALRRGAGGPGLELRGGLGDLGLLLLPDVVLLPAERLGKLVIARAEAVRVLGVRGEGRRRGVFLRIEVAFFAAQLRERRGIAVGAAVDLGAVEQVGVALQGLVRLGRLEMSSAVPGPSTRTRTAPGGLAF